MENFFEHTDLSNLEFELSDLDNIEIDNIETLDPSTAVPLMTIVAPSSPPLSSPVSTEYHSGGDASPHSTSSFVTPPSSQQLGGNDVSDLDLDLELDVDDLDGLSNGDDDVVLPNPLDEMEDAIYALFPKDVLVLDRKAFNAWRKKNRVQKLDKPMQARLTKLRRRLHSRLHAKKARVNSKLEGETRAQEMQRLRDTDIARQRELQRVREQNLALRLSEQTMKDQNALLLQRIAMLEVAMLEATAAVGLR